MPEPTPKPAADRWSDLNARMISAAAMSLIGLVDIILGGVWFQGLVVFVTAVIVWELWMMISPDRPVPGMLMAVLTASLLSAALTGPTVLLLFVIVPAIGAVAVTRERATFAAFTLYVMLSGWALVQFRAEYGLTWIIWLVLVVIATDVFGYFAGRIIGGPKFWPKVSPKKTWAGTAAGWVAAGVVGLVFALFTDMGFTIVIISMVTSFASQMGDIAESAFKRRMGAKDSSTLIPGHGGFFDRFDALLGASAFLLLVSLLTGGAGLSF